jgi:exodeoxyribonuclease VII small subunit
MADETSPVAFEAALEELERMVQRLESGELSLEASLAAFERGIGLVRSLNDKLSEVEQRVEVLMRDGDGTLRTQPLEPQSE